MPTRYTGIDATKRESYAIAAIGFVLSTGFWVALGDLASAIRRRRRAPT